MFFCYLLFFVFFCFFFFFLFYLLFFFFGFFFSFFSFFFFFDKEIRAKRTVESKLYRGWVKESDQNNRELSKARTLMNSTSGQCVPGVAQHGAEHVQCGLQGGRWSEPRVLPLLHLGFWCLVKNEITPASVRKSDIYTASS